MPTVRASHSDFDRDGLADRWNVSLRVRKPVEGTELAGGTVALGFDYQTSNVVKMQMETLAVLDLENLPRDVRSVKTVGSL